MSADLRGLQRLQAGSHIADTLGLPTYLDLGVLYLLDNVDGARWTWATEDLAWWGMMLDASKGLDPPRSVLCMPVEVLLDKCRFRAEGWPAHFDAP